MRDFDTKALILFPSIVNFEHKPYNYKNQFKIALNNLITYLEQRDITPHAFYTDDVARLLSNDRLKFIRTLPMNDMLFASKQLENMGSAMLLESEDTFISVIREVVQKYPDIPGASNEARLELLIQRNNAAVKKIIPQYNIVFHFLVPKRGQYRVTSKPDDGKIRVNIDANTFVPKVLMGGHEENPCDIFDLPNGNRALDLWGY